MLSVFVFVRWSEEAIRRHWPAVGKGILISSGTGVRRRVYTVGVRETQNGNPGRNEWDLFRNQQPRALWFQSRRGLNLVIDSQAGRN